MNLKPIRSALISVFHKDGLETIVRGLHSEGVILYSTGGTEQWIRSLDIPVVPVESITGFPSILDGRVKTLHPAVFGGILAKREESHLSQLEKYSLPQIDLVIVDLYPFEKTVASTEDHDSIIEKIDIGGISLIRAAAKNFADVVIVPAQAEYPYLLEMLSSQGAASDLEQRRYLANRAFQVSSSYDTAIFQYFNKLNETEYFSIQSGPAQVLRYGENPHQQATFYGDLDEVFDILNGKTLSFNNLVDVDAGIQLIREFAGADPTFAILKHNNSCGLATRITVLEAWNAALAGDPVSAFGGILVTNATIDIETAREIDHLFYEVLIAPEYSEEALELLSIKKNRILLQLKPFETYGKMFRNLLNGVIVQDQDSKTETKDDLKVVTEQSPTVEQIQDLLFANICVKHLKSNGIALVKNKQLIGMGCGQTSRVDSLNNAIYKSRQFGFDLQGAVMASEAFFPFPDCVAIAHEAGISAVIQPGGSVKDQDSIAACNERQMSMVMTGVRHFKH
jgi:phosphoribosylaminoimidazolecarboxamide formyltransferase/IMP cyclohydrolase